MESSKLELVDTVDNIDSVIDNVEAICSRLIEAISEASNLPFECFDKLYIAKTTRSRGYCFKGRFCFEANVYMYSYREL